jgi:hypothetical protein
MSSVATSSRNKSKFKDLETPPPIKTKVKTKGYMVTVNEMVGNAVVVRDYEQENLDYLSRNSPHPSASQPVIDIEYDVKQQLDKIYNQQPPKINKKILEPSRTSIRKSTVTLKDAPSPKQKQTNNAKNYARKTEAKYDASEEEETKNEQKYSTYIEQKYSIPADNNDDNNNGSSKNVDDEDTDDYGDDDYEEDDDFEGDTTENEDQDSIQSSTLESEKNVSEINTLNRLRGALEVVINALNAGGINNDEIYDFLNAANGIESLTRKQDGLVSRILAAIDALAGEGYKEVQMLLANGALNVLTIIISSSCEDENGDDNLQLEALSVMLNLVLAGYSNELNQQKRVSKSGVFLGINELDFVVEKLLRLLLNIAETNSQLQSRQETACKIIKCIAGVGGAESVSRLQNDRKIDGLRLLLEILERTDPNDDLNFKVNVSSCVLSLLVHSRSNALYVNSYSGSRGTSGTSVVATAIDAYADDKDIQRLAAPATQQLFKSNRDSSDGSSVVQRSRPSTAHSSSTRHGTFFGTYTKKQATANNMTSKNIRNGGTSIPKYVPGQWGTPSMETLTREYKEVVRTIAGIRHTDNKGRRDGRGLTADAMNAINRCEKRKKYLIDQIRKIELDRTYRMRARAKRKFGKRKKNGSMPALHSVTSPQNPYIPHKRKQNQQKIPPTSPSKRGPIDAGEPPSVEKIEDRVRRKFKDRYSPPKDATWYTGNFAKDVQQLKTKLGLDGSVGSLKRNFKSLRARADPNGPSLSKAVQPPPGLEAPQWNGGKNRNDVEIAMALIDRTSIPEKSPYASMPRFIVTMEDAEIFAPSQLSKLQAVQSEIDSIKPFGSNAPNRKQRRPQTATGIGSNNKRTKKKRPRRVRPMTSTGIRSDTNKSRLTGINKRPVSSPGNRNQLSRIAARKKSREEINRRNKNASRMRNVSSAPLLGRDNNANDPATNNVMSKQSNNAPLIKLDNIDEIDTISATERGGKKKGRKITGPVMIPNSKFRNRPKTAPIKRKKKKKKKKVQQIISVEVIDASRIETSKKYKRRKRQNATFSKSVKRRAKSKMEKLQEKSAVKIQAIARGKLGRKSVEEKKQQLAAATNIQRIIRGKLDRKVVQQKVSEIESAKKIQALQRGKQDRERVQKLKEQRDAARRIQSLQRGKVQRARVAKMRNEAKAAQHIQKVSRGKLARKRVAKIKDERNAAQHIQRIGRGKMARKRVAKLKDEEKAAAHIQRITRGKQARKRVQSIKIQRSKLWDKIWDDENQAYYYEHSETGESTWEQPGEYFSDVETEEEVATLEVGVEAATEVVTGTPMQSNASPIYNATTSSGAEQGEEEHYDEEEQYLRKEEELKKMLTAPMPPPSVSITTITTNEMDETNNTDENTTEINRMELGMQVMAMAKGWSDHYPGVISSTNDDGTYDVSFDDGDYQSNIPIANIYIKNDMNDVQATTNDKDTGIDLQSKKQQQKYKIGSYIKATCADWNDWYPGLIDTYDINSNTYQVRFDDGDVKSYLPESSIKNIVESDLNESSNNADLKEEIMNEKSDLQKQLNELSNRNYDDHNFDEKSTGNKPESAEQNTKRWFDPNDDDGDSSETSYSDDDNEYGEDDDFL